MPSLLERIKARESIDHSALPTDHSAGDIPTYLPTLRVDPASGDVVRVVPCVQRFHSDSDHALCFTPTDYRAPWRDNLTARDETGL